MIYIIKVYHYSIYYLYYIYYIYYYMNFSVFILCHASMRCMIPCLCSMQFVPFNVFCFCMSRFNVGLNLSIFVAVVVFFVCVFVT